MGNKKPYTELSEVGKFHTFSKRYGEYVEVSDANADLMDFMLATRARIDDTVKESSWPESKEGRHLQKIVKSVLEVELVGDSKDDPIEIAKLKRAKGKIKRQVRDVIKSIIVYIRSIKHLIDAKSTGISSNIADGDDTRTRAHNQLMHNIGILNRSLNWWFTDFDPETLTGNHLKMYEKQKKQYIVQNINHLKIPENGICPMTSNVHNRRAINKWAKDIYIDLNRIDRLVGTSE